MSKKVKDRKPKPVTLSVDEKTLQAYREICQVERRVMSYEVERFMQYQIQLHTDDAKYEAVHGRSASITRVG